MARIVQAFRKRLLRLSLAGLILLAAGIVLQATVEFRFTGDYEGLYLLKGTTRRFQVADDIFLGDEKRIIFTIPYEPVRAFFTACKFNRQQPPYLTFDWNSRGGRGFVINHYERERKLLTCFGRYQDDSGVVPSGIFLGGGLPYSEGNEGNVIMNATGMAFYDGRRWLHLWCNVNEFIASSQAPDRPIFPGQWGFQGSRIIRSSPGELILSSSHLTVIDGLPVLIDKYAFFRAPDTYFILATKITNVGASILGYYYSYGDEPWLGNFGSSKGNVGWIKDRIILYEGTIDTQATSFMGFFDIGNCLVDEGHDFTGTANFIEWLGGQRPDMAYFTNKIGPLRGAEEKIPLFAEFSRSLYLQWGPRFLLPGGSETYLIAIGMAQTRKTDELPQKPEVKLDSAMLAVIR